MRYLISITPLDNASPVAQKMALLTTQIPAPGCLDMIVQANSPDMAMAAALDEINARDEAARREQARAALEQATQAQIEADRARAALPSQITQYRPGITDNCDCRACAPPQTCNCQFCNGGPKRH